MLAQVKRVVFDADRDGCSFLAFGSTAASHASRPEGYHGHTLMLRDWCPLVPVQCVCRGGLQRALTLILTNVSPPLERCLPVCACISACLLTTACLLRADPITLPCAVGRVRWHRPAQVQLSLSPFRRSSFRSSRRRKHALGPIAAAVVGMWGKR